MQLPLNVSPVSASFIGLQRLGILLVLSLACLTFARGNTLASSSVSRFLLSALGKIEVIMFYSVIKVRVRVP